MGLKHLQDLTTDISFCCHMMANVQRPLLATLGGLRDNSEVKKAVYNESIANVVDFYTHIVGVLATPDINCLCRNWDILAERSRFIIMYGSCFN